MGMTAGCFSTQVELGGSSRFDRLPPCSPPYRITSCEMEEVTTQHDPDVSYVLRLATPSDLNAAQKPTLIAR